MTNINLSNLKPGDTIKYDYIVGMNDVAIGQGEIIEITEEHIKVQKPNRYYDKLLLRDIQRNWTRILSHKSKGDKTMENKKKVTESRPDRDEIIAKYNKLKAVNPEQSMSSIAKELKVPISTLHTWLNKEKKQSQKFGEILDSVDEGKQKAEAELPLQLETGFTIQDEEPIPYTVLPREVVTDHHVIATEIATLLDAKRADYGADNIRKFGSLGVLIRVSDKVERLINLQDKKTNFETKEDTWLDIAGYAMLALIELRAGR